MGNEQSGQAAAGQGEAFLADLLTRLWVTEVPEKLQPRELGYDKTDEVVLPVELPGEDMSNMALPRDVWLLIFGYLLNPRHLGTLCAVCKSYRRIVLQADKHWKRLYEQWLPGKRPSRKADYRCYLAYSSRVFLGDRLLPEDLETWQLVPGERIAAEMRFLVASMEPACGKSNMITRFVRNRFIGDGNRLSVALEQMSHKARLTLGDQIAVDVEVVECTTHAIEQYLMAMEVDAVIFASCFTDVSAFGNELERLRSLLRDNRGCAPLVVARTKSDTCRGTAGASDVRRMLRTFKVPFVSTSAFLGTNCHLVFEVATKLAIALSLVQTRTRQTK